MKNKETTKKKFDAVKMMREIRDKMDKETEGMSFEEEKKYFKRGAEKFHKNTPSGKE